MPVLYKVKKIERKYSDGRVDPANNKWYANAVIVNTVSTDKIAERIEEKCSLTKSDVKGCIEALIYEIKTQLQNSYAVKLDGLGTFKMSAARVPKALRSSLSRRTLWAPGCFSSRQSRRTPLPAR